METQLAAKQRELATVNADLAKGRMDLMTKVIYLLILVLACCLMRGVPDDFVVVLQGFVAPCCIKEGCPA